MIVVMTSWSFFIGICALTPWVVLFTGWPRGTTNDSRDIVVDSMNESRGCADC